MFNIPSNDQIKVVVRCLVAISTNVLITSSSLLFIAGPPKKNISAQWTV
jgi:hypothetical protein